MSIPPPSGNRLKYLDEENKVLVQEFGELQDNEPINEDHSVNAETVLASMQETKAALQSLLQSPMDAINAQLDSGRSASEMMNSITNTVSEASADIRCTLATITSTVNSAQQLATSLTNSVMGTINTALRQVPAAINHLHQIPTSVKKTLLNTSLTNYSNQLSSSLGSVPNKVNTVLGTVSGAAQGVSSNLTAVRNSVSSVGFTVGQNVQLANNIATNVSTKITQAGQSVTGAKQLFVQASSSVGLPKVSLNLPPISPQISPVVSYTPLQEPSATAAQQFYALESTSVTPQTTALPSVSNDRGDRFPSLLPIPSVLTVSRQPTALVHDSYRAAITQASVTRLSQALSDTATRTEIGTTSSLLPVTNYAVNDPAVAIDPIAYTDHALTFILGALTWYRSLYTYTYRSARPSIVTPTYGSGLDHYAVLTNSATELQSEQFKNFGMWVRTSSPDAPTKNLYLFECYQELLQAHSAELRTAPNTPRTLEIMAHLSAFTTAFPLKPLLTDPDYERLASRMTDFVDSAVGNHYRLSTSAQFTQLYTELFTQIVTDAAAAHLGAGPHILKRGQAIGEITLHCGVRLMRALLQRFNELGDPTGQQRVLEALNALLTLSVEQLRYLHTDPYDLVIQGQRIYRTPDTRAVEELTFPLIKHYLHNKARIRAAKQHLLSSQERDILDEVLGRLDALAHTYPQEMQAIQNNTDPIHYTALSSTHRLLGRNLSFALIASNLENHDSFDLPERSFEKYSTGVEYLYFDQDSALQR